MVGYSRGLKEGDRIHRAADNELRIDMMAVGVCTWSRTYREAMGCEGEGKARGKPVPRFPEEPDPAVDEENFDRTGQLESKDGAATKPPAASIAAATSPF